MFGLLYASRVPSSRVSFSERETVTRDTREGGLVLVLTELVYHRLRMGVARRALRVERRYHGRGQSTTFEREFGRTWSH